MPGELFLLIGLIINSLAISLMIKADFGISALDSLPYVLSLAFPVFSNGTWNAIVQSFWLLFTMIAIRKFKPGYLLSFLLAFVFGILLNFWAGLILPWSNELLPRVFYFISGFFILSFGISLLMVCGTPVLPFDTVVRAFTMEKNMSIRKARTGFDLLNLILSISVSLIFIHRLVGIGIGTILSALLIGTLAQKIISLLKHYFDIKPKIAWLGKLV